MKRVYCNELLPMAGYIQSMLQNSGIACSMKNQALAGAMGEIPPQECWPEVWIHDDDQYDDAMHLINSMTPDINGAEAEWVCQCGEENAGEFFSCWNCGQDKPLTGVSNV